MRILGIETSCDETGIALIEAEGGLTRPRFRVLKNFVASQIKIHQPFGGVVPNLAKREHLKNLPILTGKVLGISNFQFPISKQILNPKFKILNSIDLIGVTVGPVLEPALWTGINFAKELYQKLKIENSKLKIIGTNHLEGHLYSFLLPKKQQKTVISNFQFPISKIFPAIALIVSGGHTILLYVESFSKWTRLGETRDDAAGEPFDKVARLLKLPYPGGPEIEKLAMKGNPFTIAFPRPMLDQKNYDFSFSGLKTAVLYYLRDHASQESGVKSQDVAASFEQAVVDVLVAKTKRAAEEYGAESILLSGGVAANKHLRKALKRTAETIGTNFFVPDFKYNLDNGVMIAVAGYFSHLRKKKYKFEAQGNLEI